MANTDEVEEPAWRVRTGDMCLALPDVVLTLDGPFEHTAFRVNGKIFAYYLVNHHDDGRIAVWCKGQIGLQDSLVRSDPDRYFMPPYVGPRGWIGIRLDGQRIDWEEIEGLLEMSYRMTASKRQCARLEGE